MDMGEKWKSTLLVETCYAQNVDYNLAILYLFQYFRGQLLFIIYNLNVPNILLKLNRAQDTTQSIYLYNDMKVLPVKKIFFKASVPTLHNSK